MNASEILNRITKAKRSQVETVRYVLGEDTITGEKLRWCGNWLHLREWITSSESRLINANFCKKHLLCRACAIRRAGRLVEAYTPKIETVLETTPGLIPAMVTLTVKNGALEESVERLKAAWSRMLTAKRKGASKSGRHQLVEWNKVAGSLRALEVTAEQKRDGFWHPHLHVFVLLTDYIDRDKLIAEWQTFTGDDSWSVGVTRCKNGIVPGLIEVLKYSTKFSSMTPAQVWEVHQALRGSRLVDPQGCLRGVREPDIDSDSIEGLEGPFRDFIATWLWSEQRYRLREQLPLPTKPVPGGQTVFGRIDLAKEISEWVNG